MKTIVELIRERAKFKRQKVGIILNKENLSEREKWYPKAIEFADIIATDNPTQLIELLKKNEIKAIVRGQLKGQYSFEKELKSIYNFKEDYRCSIIKDVCGRVFFFGPTGLIGMNCYDGRKKYIIRVINYINNFRPDHIKIALLSPIWEKDVLDLLNDSNLSDFDRTLFQNLLKKDEENKILVQELKSMGFDAYNYGNRLEKALWDECNFIVAFNGIYGNAISRSLWLIDNRKISSKAELISLPLLTEKQFSWIFENTSSSELDFSNHIISATAFLNANEG